MSTIADLTALAKLEGPFVSAYLDSPSNEPNAAFRLTTHWKTTRASLSDAGVDEETLRAMDAAVGVDTAAVEPQASSAPENHPAAALDAAGDHAGGDVLAVVAADGEVLLREHLPSVSGAGTARVGPVPWLTPLLEAAQTCLPYLLVLADRTGADIHGVGRHAEVDKPVEGSHDVIERNHPGGWSQRRYQRRGIDSWERNAEEVAAEVEHIARRLHAQLILIGGDTHAVSYIRDALPPRWRKRVQVLEHATRAAGGDDEAMQAEIDELVRVALADEQARILERFAEEKGQHDKAADGPARVTEALQAAMVEVLLVNEQSGGERQAWFGPEPNHLGLDRGDLEAMGVSDPQQAPLIDVAIRAALGTGATVALVPPSAVRDGLGAILRA